MILRSGVLARLYQMVRNDWRRMHSPPGIENLLQAGLIIAARECIRGLADRLL